MAKTRSQYVCQRCGKITAAFVGKCPQCSEFGTMVEQIVREDLSSNKGRAPSSLMHSSQPARLKELQGTQKKRLSIDNAEFSRVIGGGFVRGSLLLLGGDPGIGKSTLLLDIAACFAEQHGRVLYVSGEESAFQIKMRADRLGITAEELLLVTETELEIIIEHVATTEPGLVIVDSIQTTYTDQLTSSAGSISQVKECAARLQELAKNSTTTYVND